MDDYFNLFSNIYSKSQTLDEKFAIFADFLLNGCIMYIGKNKYFLEEVEFYYHTKSHEDKYVHQMKDQKTSQKWYFHKYKTGVYKSGTYKGMDLTFGNETTFGGILIRAIQNAVNGQYIIGPCNVVNHILSQLEMSSVDELVSNMKVEEAFSDKNPFYLKTKRENNFRIFRGPRVGLSTKYPEYMFKNYRFLKSPNVTLKYKDTIVSVLYNEGMSSTEIEKLTCISRSTIAKAINTYEIGKNMDDIEGEKNINILFGFYSK
jgi:hypothetical protein